MEEIMNTKSAMNQMASALENAQSNRIGVSDELQKASDVAVALSEMFPGDETILPLIDKLHNAINKASCLNG